MTGLLPLTFLGLIQGSWSRFAAKGYDMKQSTLLNVGVPSAAIRPKTIAELEAALRKGQRVVSLLVTPTLAAAILEKWNDGNRRVDQITVQRYRRDMETDHWLRDGEIGFGVSLSYVKFGDGQHRLHAQVASGTEQQYTARVFSDQEEYDIFCLTTGGGRNRSMADQFKVFGIVEGVGACAMFEQVVNAMQTFLGARPGRLSKQERMEFALKNVAPIRYVLALPKKGFRAHVRAAIAFAHTKRAKDVAAMLDDVNSGANLTGGSPALKLMQALPELNDAKGTKEKDRAMGRVLRALYDGVTGKRTTSIMKSKNDTMHMRTVIAYFVSSDVAEQWIERQKAAR